jgi:hypothetical protein
VRSVSERPAEGEGPSLTALLGRLGVAAGPEDPEVLPHNGWLSPGVWRVRTDDGRRAVLKWARADRDRGRTAWDAHWTARDHEPSRWNYWAREALCYRDHLSDVFAGAGLAGPPCRAWRIEDDEALLLLDWVDGRPGDEWSVPDYGPAAEALGRAQAPFLAGRPLPGVDWLSRGFLRDYPAEKPVDWGLLDDDGIWRHPVVRRSFAPGLREGAAFLHSHRERLTALVEALPRTLCHLDFWPKNLIRRPDGHHTLLDWSVVGIGAVGEDVGNLVPDASFDHFVAARDLPGLERVVLEAYLAGLRSSGWDDDPRLVQLGMWASAIKYDWLTPFSLAQVDQPRHLRYGGGAEVDPDYKFSQRSQVLVFLAGWARQALELADRLGR